jgi:hypothetical protein
MAKMITKRFKVGAFYEFLKIRHTLWKIQFSILIIALCVGFPSTILSKIRRKLEFG